MPGARRGRLLPHLLRLQYKATSREAAATPPQVTTSREAAATPHDAAEAAFLTSSSPHPARLASFRAPPSPRCAFCVSTPGARDPKRRSSPRKSNALRDPWTAHSCSAVLLTSHTAIPHNAIHHTLTSHTPSLISLGLASGNFSSHFLGRRQRC